MGTRCILTLLASSAIVFCSSIAEAQRNFGPYDRDQRSSVDRAANRLVNELEHLVEDMAINRQGRQDWRLYREADAVLSEAIHFQRTAERGMDRAHLYRDFQTLDEQLHSLIRKLEDPRGGAVRGLSRVQYADDQLHRALSLGDRTPGRQAEVVARQAHALDREAQAFTHSAQQILAGDWRNVELRNAIQDFANKTSHFHRAVEQTNDPEHLARDFHDLQRSHVRMVNNINLSNPSAYFYRQAERITETFNELKSRISGVERSSHDSPELRFHYRGRHE